MKTNFGFDCKPLTAGEICNIQQLLAANKMKLEKRLVMFLVPSGISFVLGILFGSKYIMDVQEGFPIGSAYPHIAASAVACFMFLFAAAVVKQSLDGVNRDLNLVYGQVSFPDYLTRTKQLSDKFDTVRNYLQRVKESGRDFLIYGEYWMIDGSESRLAASTINKEIF